MSRIVGTPRPGKGWLAAGSFLKAGKGWRALATECNPGPCCGACDGVGPLVLIGDTTPLEVVSRDPNFGQNGRVCVRYHYPSCGLTGTEPMRERFTVRVRFHEAMDFKRWFWFGEPDTPEQTEDLRIDCRGEYRQTYQYTPGDGVQLIGSEGCGACYGIDRLLGEERYWYAYNAQHQTDYPSLFVQSPAGEDANNRLRVYPAWNNHPGRGVATGGLIQDILFTSAYYQCATTDDGLSSFSVPPGEDPLTWVPTFRTCGSFPVHSPLFSKPLGEDYNGSSNISMRKTDCGVSASERLSASIEAGASQIPGGGLPEDYGSLMHLLDITYTLDSGEVVGFAPMPPPIDCYGGPYLDPFNDFDLDPPSDGGDDDGGDDGGDDDDPPIDDDSPEKDPPRLPGDDELPSFGDIPVDTITSRRPYPVPDGFDAEQERRRTTQGGCCGQPSG